MEKLNRTAWRFTALFLTTIVALDLSYYWSSGTIVERLLIDTLTVAPSAILINAIDPLENARAEGHRLISPAVRLSVLNGCEGTEAMMLPIAAIVAFSARWKDKLLGIVVGVVLVYAINQCRIVGLYYALRYDKSLFDLSHGYIGPTFVVIVSGLFFLWWVNNSGRNNVASTAA